MHSRVWHSKSMEKRFKDICWDTEDLISSKQGLCVLLRCEGIEAVTELLDSDPFAFGNLDTDAVLEEEGY